MNVMRGVISAVVFAMLMVILAMNPAKAGGNVSWSIQLNFPAHNHGGHLGTIGTPPSTHTHHNHGRHLNHHYHPNGYYSVDHMHYYDGRYGWHYHQGHRYNVVHEFRNHHGELCREFEMNIHIGGYPQLGWGIACRDRSGFWRLQQ